MKGIKELELKKNLLEKRKSQIDVRIAEIEELKSERSELSAAIKNIDEVIEKLREIYDIPEGQSNNVTNFTEEQKQAVRDDYSTGKFTQKALADKYKCRHQYISKIVKDMPRPEGARSFGDELSRVSKRAKEKAPTEPLSEDVAEEIFRQDMGATITTTPEPKKTDKRKSYLTEPLDTDFYDEDETLTNGDVKKIREDYAEGDSISNLAKHYKVEFSVIEGICLRVKRNTVSVTEQIERLGKDHPGFYEWCINHGYGLVAEGSKQFPELIDKYYDEVETVEA